MTRLRDDFAALVQDRGAVDLARAALSIARLGHPDLDPSPTLQRLDELARAIRDRAGRDRAPEVLAGALTDHLLVEGRLRGNADDYYDPRNSFLNDVLARGLGIPISIAVAVIEVGRRLGVDVQGIGFPGHFLVRVPAVSGPRLLDPFFGRPIAEPELLARLESLSQGHPARPTFSEVPAQYLEPTSARGILGRMLRNLLQIYRERDDPERALGAVDLMLVLEPHAAGELRIRAELFERLECWGAAMDDLRRYLALAPMAADAAQMRAHLAELARIAPSMH